LQYYNIFIILYYFY